MYKVTEKFLQMLKEYKIEDLTAPTKIELSEGDWVCCYLACGSDNTARLLIERDLLGGEWIMEEKQIKPEVIKKSVGKQILFYANDVAIDLPESAENYGYFHGKLIPAYNKYELLNMIPESLVPGEKAKHSVTFKCVQEIFLNILRFCPENLILEEDKSE